MFPAFLDVSWGVGPGWLSDTQKPCVKHDFTVEAASPFLLRRLPPPFLRPWNAAVTGHFTYFSGTSRFRISRGIIRVNYHEIHTPDFLWFLWLFYANYSGLVAPTNLFFGRLTLSVALNGCTQLQAVSQLDDPAVASCACPPQGMHQHLAAKHGCDGGMAGNGGTTPKNGPFVIQF